MKQAAMRAAALLAYSPSRVLGANDRMRLGMIGVAGRGQDLLKQVRNFPTRSWLPSRYFESPRRRGETHDSRHSDVATPVFLHSEHLFQP